MNRGNLESFGAYQKALELFDPVLGRIDVRDELEITLIDGLQDFGQGRQTVDSLLEGSILGSGGAIPMLNLPVLLKEGDVVECGVEGVGIIRNTVKRS